MAKLTLDPIGSFTQAAVNTINNNMDRIEAAVEKTLSRDGTVPNQLEADLDLNENDILNVNDIHVNEVYIEGQPIHESIQDLTQLAENAADSAAGSALSASASATEASNHADSAETSKDYAYQWSSSPEDEIVDDGEHVGYSAYHWSKKAEVSAGGGIQSVSSAPGSPIEVDNTDNVNPVLDLAQGTKDSISSAVQPGDLATVATSGDYGDLSGTPVLGDLASLDEVTVSEISASGTPSSSTYLRGDGVWAAGGGGGGGQVDEVVAGANVTVDNTDPTRPIVSASGGGGAVDSVNGQTGVVVLDADDISDSSTTKKFTTAAEKSKLAGIEALADVTSTAKVDAAGAVMDGDFSSNGLMVRASSGAYTARSISGTTNQITVSNGSGVSNNPTIALHTSVTASLAAANTAVQPAAISNVLRTPDIGVTVQPFDASTAKLDVEGQTLTGGVDVSAKALGVITTGTVTIEVEERPLQSYTNNGNHALVPGASFGGAILDIVNGSSAGTIDLSAWDKVFGDPLSTTDGDEFRCHVSTGPNGSMLIIQSMQGDSILWAALNIEDQILTGGATVTSKDLGTVTTGTVTANAGHRPQQHYVNDGAHTLSPGVANGSYLLDITNGASAGVITTTGWTKVAGDNFTTVDGDKFRCHCSIGPAGSLLIVQALQ